MQDLKKNGRLFVTHLTLHLKVVGCVYRQTDASWSICIKQPTTQKTRLKRLSVYKTAQFWQLLDKCLEVGFASFFPLLDSLKRSDHCESTRQKTGKSSLCSLHNCNNQLIQHNTPVFDSKLKCEETITNGYLHSCAL